ncbi:MAG: SRPBCC family protein [Gemmatimonadales bacterium]
MKWIGIGAAAIAAQLLVAVVAGAMLPREHRASSRLSIPRPIDQVWTFVRDFGRIPSYWSDFTEVERLPDDGGREVWLEKGSQELTIAVTEESPPTRLVTTIVAPAGAPFGGRWIYELVTTADGTDLTVTEDGWVDNKIFRVVAKAMGHHRTLDAYLTALGRKLGSASGPVHLEP